MTPDFVILLQVVNLYSMFYMAVFCFYFKVLSPFLTSSNDPVSVEFLSFFNNGCDLFLLFWHLTYISMFLVVLYKLLKVSGSILLLFFNNGLLNGTGGFSFCNALSVQLYCIHSIILRWFTCETVHYLFAFNILKVVSELQFIVIY